MKLVHSRFGLGEVVKETKESVTILFDCGEKTLMRAFAPLTNEDGTPYYVSNEKKVDKVAKANKRRHKAEVARREAEERRKNNPIQALKEDLLMINSAVVGDKHGAVTSIWVELVRPIAAKARKENNKPIIDILAKAYRSASITDRQAYAVASFA